MAFFFPSGLTTRLPLKHPKTLQNKTQNASLQQYITAALHVLLPGCMHMCSEECVRQQSWLSTDYHQPHACFPPLRTPGASSMGWARASSCSARSLSARTGTTLSGWRSRDALSGPPSCASRLASSGTTWSGFCCTSVSARRKQPSNSLVFTVRSSQGPAIRFDAHGAMVKYGSKRVGEKEMIYSIFTHGHRRPPRLFSKNTSASTRLCMLLFFFFPPCGRQGNQLTSRT